MSTQFSAKQPYEEFAISFDFTSVLGAETIASATITAVDQESLVDATATILEVLNQTNTDTVVYGWVRAGTSGRTYLITCRIDGSLGSHYELEALQPVMETPAGTSGPLVIPPVIEPITVADLKMHLRLDSGTFDGNLTVTQSLAYGSKGIANNYTTHVGAGVDVLGKQAEAMLHCGANGATGTNDTKIQESDDNATYTDWTGGAFTQVTTANDNADYKKAYTGTKRYIRTVSKVLLAACEFGTSILVNAATSSEDDLLTALITAARERVEDITRRALLTQTWDYSLDRWPRDNFIVVPYGNLQSITSVKYKDTAGAETTLTATTDYLVETNGEGYGRIVLPYGAVWPSGSLYPSNPITIRFVAGWTTAALVPSKIRTAIKMICADMYETRESTVTQSSGNVTQNKAVEGLLASARLWREF